MDPLKILEKDLIEEAYKDQKILATELRRQADEIVENESHKIYHILSKEFDFFQQYLKAKQQPI